MTRWLPLHGGLMQSRSACIQIPVEQAVRFLLGSVLSVWREALFNGVGRAQTSASPLLWSYCSLGYYPPLDHKPPDHESATLSAGGRGTKRQSGLRSVLIVVLCVCTRDAPF